MNEKEIRDAVSDIKMVFKGEEEMYESIMKLTSLAEKILNAKMPEKKFFGEVFERGSNCDFNYVNAYNQAIDECKLILARDYISKDKLLTVEEIEDTLFKLMSPVLCEKTKKGEWIIPNPEVLGEVIFTAQQEKMKGVKP